MESKRMHNIPQPLGERRHYGAYNAPAKVKEKPFCTWRGSSRRFSVSFLVFDST